jgi:trk system potassium uptake protein TrkA
VRLGEEGFISNLCFTAIKRRQGETIIPKGNDYILEGDEVFAIGSREAIAHLLELSGVSLNQRLNRVIIAGSGRIGIYLAQALEASGTQVKMIEADLEKAEAASNILKRTTVLHGDYLDPGFLEEAGVNGVEGFVSVTGDDEHDVMACVTAKQNGAARVLALVQKPRYLPILAAIPTLDAAVSSHLTAVGNILRLVRRGQIVSVASLREIDAEVIELVAGRNSKIIHKNLTSLRGELPDDALIGAIVRRDQVLVPTGDSVIQTGDRVIVFSMPDAIPSVEKLFTERVGGGKPVWSGK